MNLFLLLMVSITGQNGINSDVTGLEGTDVQLAQIEIEGRSGWWRFDSPANSNSDIEPWAVYVGSGFSLANANISDHATWVAGLMIGADVGVASGALLHSAMPGFGGDLWADRASVMNRFARQGQISAINLSWGMDLAGAEAIMTTAYLTEFVDWSAKQHKTLYVAAHPYSEKPFPTPADNYNGITVAGAQKTGDVYDKVWDDNYYDDVPSGRSMTDILAPAIDIPLRGPGNVNVNAGFGTSFSAPLVTGTVALMDEYAEEHDLHLDLGNHLVRKSLIMNGADKQAGALGSARTIKRRDNSTWVNSSAYEATGTALDIELGVGMLNVKNTIDNLAADKQAAGIDPVPTTGWDFGQIGGTGAKVEYIFDQPLSGWFSATLTWDRNVESSSDDEYEYGAMFFNQPLDQQLTNLDLYLVPADDENSDNAVDLSVDPLENVEHIFWNIETPGMYKLVVFNSGDRGEPEEFGLAWRSGSSTSIPGDFDNDGDVDGDDLGEWKSNFGTGSGADADGDGDSDGADFLAWQQNLGTGVPAIATTAAVPEPAAWLLAIVGLPLLLRARGRVGQLL